MTARVEYRIVAMPRGDDGPNREALAGILNDAASAGWRVVATTTLDGATSGVVMEREATEPVLRRDDPALCTCGHWKGAHALDGRCELTACRCARFRSVVR